MPSLEEVSDFFGTWGPLIAVVLGYLFFVIAIVISSTKLKDKKAGREAMIVFYSWGSLIMVISSLGLLLYYYQHEL